MNLPPAGHPDSPCPLFFLHGAAPAPGSVIPEVPPGCVIRTLEGRDLASPAELFRNLAQALSLPDYFGHNWDALDECLSDLAWLEAPRILLVVLAAEHVLETAPEERPVLLQILAAAPRLGTLFQSPSDELLAWVTLCREQGLPFRMVRQGEG